MHNEWKTRAGRRLSWEERIKEGLGGVGRAAEGVRGREAAKGG